MSPALRKFFASGTPGSAEAAPGGSGGPPADVDALATTLGRPCRGPGALSVKVAGTAPAVGETEASSRPGTAAGPDIEPDAQPARWGHRRLKRRVDVPADAARANPFTPASAGPVAPWG